MNKILFYAYKSLGLIACLTSLLGVIIIDKLLLHMQYNTFVLLELSLMGLALFCLTKFKCSNKNF